MKRCWKVEPKERPTFVEIHELLYDMLIDNEVSKSNRDLNPHVNIQSLFKG